MKIAVIDSGLGGLDILSKVINKSPCHQYLYLADNLNCPYGVKDGKTINRLTNNIIQYLKKLDIDIVIIACNTMSAYYQEYENYHLPIYTILDANVQAIEKLKAHKVAIIATAATIRSEVYQRRLGKVDIKYVNGSLLTKLIEDRVSDAEIEKEIKILLKLSSGNEVVLLGCTHYGLCKSLFINKDYNLTILEGGKHLVSTLPLENNMEKLSIDVCLTKENPQYEEKIKEILKNYAVTMHKINL